MSNNSRMARYHSTQVDPPQRPEPPVKPYQRRPALARWVALLVTILTVTVGLKLTVFNATYTAGVVSRSSVGETIINRLNNDLSDLGISGDPITTSVAQPYLAQGVKQLYGQTGAAVDSTDLTNAISSQASSLGITASSSITTTLSKQAQKLIAASFNTTAMQQAASRIQLAMRLNLWILIAAALLTVVTSIYAVGVHHFLGSLGPGLALGGFLTILLGVGGWMGLPVGLTSMTGTVASLLKSIGHSGLGVIIFGGIVEIVLGLLVLLGHRTFRDR